MISDNIEFKDDKIIIHNKNITDKLIDKLSEENIQTSKEIIDSHINNRKLLIDLVSCNKCKDCPELNSEYLQKCSNKPIPYGNVSADIVFVNKIPTVSECVGMLSHSDTSSYLLMLILKKTGLNPDNFYFTDFIKCPNRNISIDALWHCAVNYFLKEIKQIQPKVIVFQGLTIINMLYENGILLNKPDKIEYGIIYDSYLLGTEKPLKVMGIYDMNMVLQKEGEELQQCKNFIWHNILNVVNSI